MQADIAEFTKEFTAQLEKTDPDPANKPLTRSAMLLDDSAVVTKISEAGGKIGGSGKFGDGNNGVLD